jgi:tRNA G18 (ribose-2'-O)-methylase SpoU
VVIVREIKSFDLPELEPYRTMRRQSEHRQQRIFVAEGEKVVRRLLESNFEVVSMVLPPKWYNELRDLMQSRDSNISVFIAEKELLEQLTGFSMYQGLLAVGRIPELPSLSKVIEFSKKPRLFVAVEGLTNAENMGAVIRNCGAFHVQAVIAGETSCSPYLRRAVRGSMGAIFHIPIVETVNLIESLLELRRNGFRCIAAHPHAEARILPECDLTGDCCLVFGSEGYGLSPSVLEACTDAVAVPMPVTVDSLNVASAAAVFLYEACRQRDIWKKF